LFFRGAVRFLKTRDILTHSPGSKVTISREKIVTRYTIVPVWSPPSGHYSFHCRKQAEEGIVQQDGGWETSIPSLKDPDRLPDPSTLHRWAARRLVSLWSSLQSGLWKMVGWSFLGKPTILAWDCPACRRILRIEASSP